MKYDVVMHHGRNQAVPFYPPVEHTEEEIKAAFEMWLADKSQPRTFSVTRKPR